MPSKMLLARARSALRSAWSSRYGQVFFLVLRKSRNKKNRKSLVAPDIHNPSPTAFPHPSACDPDLAKSACSPNDVSTFWISRNQCNDVRALLRAKEPVGNREVSRRLATVCTTLLYSIGHHRSSTICMPVDTNRLRRLQKCGDASEVKSLGHPPAVINKVSMKILR
jgi:hypothetical protein